jgi:transglutaminase-like putative cysteine protease
MTAAGLRAAPPSSPEETLLQGEELARAGRTDQALAIFAGLARTYPSSEAPHLAAGNALLAAGRLEQAAREYEAAARIAREPAPILDGLARLYLDPRLRRPADALAASRAARRLEPWREESYYLQARAQEGLGDQEAARQAFRVLLANFPRGEYRPEAEQGLARLSRLTYEVTLSFRFVNRGVRRADRVHLRVQAAQDFPPYSEARLVELPEGGHGRQLADGTRYFSFDTFSLAPGEERSFRIRYAVAVAAAAYQHVGSTPAGDDLRGWLAPSPFIESDAPAVVSLAGAIAPDAAPYDRARGFYEFVLKRLTYVVQDQTLGALGALANPGHADCTEFASLFIALARAARIPARPVFGYLYEPGKSSYEISHLWAEFWDADRGWVTADPTNGSLAPDRYFGRVESDYIPLWIPSAEFGDLAGVRVSYESTDPGDTLSTGLVAEIRLLGASEFEAVPEQPIRFAAAGANDLRGRTGGIPLGPAAALCILAVGLVLWQRRRTGA